MKTKTIKLKGYTAEMAAYLTTSVDRGYQKQLTKGVETDGGDVKIKIGLDQMMDAQDYLLKEMLISLSKGEEKVENPYDAVMEMESSNTKKLYEYLEKVVRGGGEKKAGSATASNTKKA